jgi:hypothetical protein
MIITVDDLASVLGLDLSTASAQLAEARMLQQCNDSPSNRAAVADARARMDALLDMYVDAGGARR